MKVKHDFFYVFDVLESIAYLHELFDKKLAHRSSTHIVFINLTAISDTVH